MKRALVAAAVAAMALATACGNSDPGTASQAEETGSVKFNVTSIVGGDLMATIVVRNVFDHSLMYVVDCNAKDHTVGGENFCDELLVLPPGVYEVIVQSHIEGCTSELDHYKVIVQPNETTELEVKFICGEANGGLDTVVTVEQKPVITDIDFAFLNGDQGNKFVCQGGTPGLDQDDTKVTITVWDSDTPCADLAADAQWLYNGVDSPTPPFVPGQATMIDLTGTPIDPLDPSKGVYPNYTCQFSNVIDAASPVGDYDITFELDQYGAEFTFPIHVIACDPQVP